MSWNLQWQPTRKVSRTAVPSHSSAVLVSGTAGATGATAGALQFHRAYDKWDSDNGIKKGRCQGLL